MLASKAEERETVLRLLDISKRFGGLVANDAISLDLGRGEILGLLGENGAGKTTLMNILFGHYVADEGSIDVNGSRLPPGDPKAALQVGIGMVHQHFTLADNLTVLDNIMLGTESLLRPVSRRGPARKRVELLAETYGLHLDPDAPVASLSVGERQRVEIVKALYCNVRILILDEPTAVLTPQETESLFETLRRFTAQGLSIIFISHKLGEILSVCQRVAILRAGRKVAERDVAGSTRADLAELMVGRAISQPKAERLQAGKVLLQLEGISGRDGQQAVRDINLTVRSHEVVGIAGVSGNGQAVLAGLISGTITPHAGTLTLVGSKLDRFTPGSAVRSGIARIPEDRHDEGLIADMSVVENVIAETCREWPPTRRGFINWSKARSLARSIIDAYQVKCEGPDARVRLLSGGNMQKLILGRVLGREPVIILANQPTRGLDVGAVAYVHDRLLEARKNGSGLILISEDLDELFALSDRIAVMYRGRLSEPVPREGLTLQQLGLMMGGQGFNLEGGRHAA